MIDSPSQNEGLTPELLKPKPNLKHRRVRAAHIRQNKLALEELPKIGRYKSKRQPNSGRFRPLWNAEQLRHKLQSYDRTPFIDLLAIWMECTPSVQDIMVFAQKHPDRFIHSMSLLGKLSGYTEKKELEVNLTAQVTRLSDSQLEDRLREAAYKLGIPLPKLLELTPAEFSEQKEK